MSSPSTRWADAGDVDGAMASHDQSLMPDLLTSWRNGAPVDGMTVTRAYNKSGIFLFEV